jgi:nucleotide-binding universal stress UspA family protein
LLVRAGKEGRAEGEATFKSIVVPLDGSNLAETVLPDVKELARKLTLDVILTRAYDLPMSAYYGAEDVYLANYDKLRAQIKEDADSYLANKVDELGRQGLERVSSVLLEGPGAEEIIKLARTTPDNLVAMCSHGRSGVKRWVLGSVTEKVVRHSGDPVLVIRAA